MKCQSKAYLDHFFEDTLVCSIQSECIRLCTLPEEYDGVFFEAIKLCE